MKIAYKHLVKNIIGNPSVEEISDHLFQLGHEHEIEKNIFNMEFTPNRGDCLSLNGLLRDLSVFYDTNVNQEIYNEELKMLDIDFAPVIIILPLSNTNIDTFLSAPEGENLIFTPA